MLLNVPEEGKLCEWAGLNKKTYSSALDNPEILMGLLSF
jgi:hypothetical protein